MFKAYFKNVEFCFINFLVGKNANHSSPNVCLSGCVSLLVTPDTLDRFWWNFLCVMYTHCHWRWQKVDLTKKFWWGWRAKRAARQRPRIGLRRWRSVCLKDGRISPKLTHSGSVMVKFRRDPDRNRTGPRNLDPNFICMPSESRAQKTVFSS